MSSSSSSWLLAVTPDVFGVVVGVHAANDAEAQSRTASSAAAAAARRRSMFLFSDGSGLRRTDEVGVAQEHGVDVVRRQLAGASFGAVRSVAAVDAGGELPEGEPVDIAGTESNGGAVAVEP